MVINTELLLFYLVWTELAARWLWFHVRFLTRTVELLRAHVEPILNPFPKNVRASIVREIGCLAQAEYKSADNSKKHRYCFANLKSELGKTYQLCYIVVNYIYLNYSFNTHI